MSYILYTCTFLLIFKQQLSVFFTFFCFSLKFSSFSLGLKKKNPVFRLTRPTLFFLCWPCHFYCLTEKKKKRFSYLRTLKCFFRPYILNPKFSPISQRLACFSVVIIKYGHISLINKPHQEAHMITNNAHYFWMTLVLHLIHFFSSSGAQSQYWSTLFCRLLSEDFWYENGYETFEMCIQQL